MGSDGTGGPIDAEGGIVDGEAALKVRSTVIPLEVYLDNNDRYYVLESVDALVKTGPTETDVNDVMVLFVEDKD